MNKFLALSPGEYILPDSVSAISGKDTDIEIHASPLPRHIYTRKPTIAALLESFEAAGVEFLEAESFQYWKRKNGKIQLKQRRKWYINPKKVGCLAPARDNGPDEMLPRPKACSILLRSASGVTEGIAFVGSVEEWKKKIEAALKPDTETENDPPDPPIGGIPE